MNDPFAFLKNVHPILPDVECSRWAVISPTNWAGDLSMRYPEFAGIAQKETYGPVIVRTQIGSYDPDRPRIWAPRNSTEVITQSHDLLISWYTGNVPEGIVKELDRVAQGGKRYLVLLVDSGHGARVHQEFNVRAPSDTKALEFVLEVMTQGKTEVTQSLRERFSVPGFGLE